MIDVQPRSIRPTHYRLMMLLLNEKNKLSHQTCTVILHDISCRKYSLVCKGGKYKNWAHQSTYLGQDFQIPHTPDNESLLHACLGKRLNPAILDKTIKNSNTQMVENFDELFGDHCLVM